MELSLPTLDNYLSKLSASSSSTSSSPPINYINQLFQNILKFVKTANHIPSGEEYTFRSSSPQNLIEIQNAIHKTQNVMKMLLNYIKDDEIKNKIQILQKKNSFEYPSIQFEIFQNCLEILSDKIDFGLELSLEAFGGDVRQCNKRRKAILRETQKPTILSNSKQKPFHSLAPNASLNEIKNSKNLISTSSSDATISIDTQASVIFDALNGRPQQNWYSFIQNFRPYFIPRIYEKPFGTSPIPSCIIEAQKINVETSCKQNTKIECNNKDEEVKCDTINPLEMHLNSLGFNKDGGTRQSQLTHCDGYMEHPYCNELNGLNWMISTNKDPQITNGFRFEEETSYFGITAPILPLKLTETPLVYVSTAKELREMINEISNGEHPVIGVDVEHHDLRSYRGFVCLVQISTREKDWIIDPFDIYEEMCWLNEVTANPSILKVLHGADNDGVWLQKDFSIYLVNIFDTHQAARTLEISGGFSLANIVRIYCNSSMEKSFKFSDWRTRPLSNKMKEYARKDAHYLPFLFDVMKNELLSRHQKRIDTPLIPATSNSQITTKGREDLYSVLMLSRAICLKCYFEDPFKPVETACKICCDYSAELSVEEQLIMIDILKWRDHIARKYDESSNYVMKDEFVLRIARNKPVTNAQLHRIFYPIPKMIDLFSKEILNVVQKSIATTHIVSSPIASPAIHPFIDLDNASQEHSSPVCMLSDNDDDAESIQEYPNNVEDEAVNEAAVILNSTSTNKHVSTGVPSIRHIENSTVREEVTSIDHKEAVTSLPTLKSTEASTSLPTIQLSAEEEGEEFAGIIKKGLEEYLFTPVNNRNEASTDAFKLKLASRIYEKLRNNVLNDILSFPIRKLKKPDLPEASNEQTLEDMTNVFGSTVKAVANTSILPTIPSIGLNVEPAAATNASNPPTIKTEAAEAAVLLPAMLPPSIAEKYASKGFPVKTRIRNVNMTDEPKIKKLNTTNKEAANSELNLNEKQLAAIRNGFTEWKREKGSKKTIDETINSPADEPEVQGSDIIFTKFSSAERSWMPAVFVDPNEIAGENQKAKRVHVGWKEGTGKRNNKRMRK